MPEFIKNARAAELAAAQSMRTLGFDDAAATPPGPDAGIDVRSKGALAQVKWKGGVAGRPDIQRLYGSCAGQHNKAMLFYSAAGYSKSAIVYANSVNIALFDYDPYGHATPQNPAARQLMERAKRKTNAAPTASRQRATTPTTADPLDLPVDRDLGQWMKSVQFLEDPQPAGRRDGTQTTAVPEPPGPIVSRIVAGVTMLLCLGLAFLAAWLLTMLITSALVLGLKIVLGALLGAGGLFVFGMAVICAGEAFTPSHKPDEKPTIWESPPKMT